MNKRIPIILGLMLTAFALWLIITANPLINSIRERLDNLGYDLQLRTRILTNQAKPQNPIAIIDIDDNSLKVLGRWPWSRGQLAALVDRLHENGAAVIAFDMFFSESEPNIATSLIDKLKKHQKLTGTLSAELEKNLSLFNEDTVFADSLNKATATLAIGFLPRVHTANQLPPPLLTITPEEDAYLSITKASGYISNIPVLQNASKGGGYINIYPDSDGIVRRIPLILQYGNGIYPALSLQTVLLFLNERIHLVTPVYNRARKLEGIQIGTQTIPTDEKGQVLIPFIGKSYTFPYYSAVDILENKIPRENIVGKILFIGTSATGLGDLQPTSIESPFPGVEIQATLVNGLLENNFSLKPAWTLGASFALTLLIGLITSFIFPYLGPRILGLLILVLPPLLLFVNNWFWVRTGFIISIIIPDLLIMFLALINILYGYLFETLRREKLKSMFGQYVPEKHIEEMMKVSGEYGLHGEDRDMSVLFADIRHFTTIAESLRAAELVDLLNTFFTPMTEIIFKNHGTIDKYVGDMVMAFWSAPLIDKRHAQHAIQAALEMHAKMKELHAVTKEKGWPEIHIGVGVNSGTMSVGDMGSRYRRNYTVLGDAVNLASRLEGLTKFYGVNIIVSEFTAHQQSKFIFRQLDRVKVKGKNEGINIYEAICLATQTTPALAEELASYHEALNAYFQQDWEKAYPIMLALHEAHPHKKIYAIYVERINEFKQQPLPKDWDGIFVHQAK